MFTFLIVLLRPIKYLIVLKDRVFFFLVMTYCNEEIRHPRVMEKGGATRWPLANYSSDQE